MSAETRHFGRRRFTDPDGTTMLVIPADQWDRIAAVVRVAVAYGYHPFVDVVDALTPDDIEAVQPEPTVADLFRPDPSNIEAVKENTCTSE